MALVQEAAQQAAAVLLLNAPYAPDRVWDELTREVQETIVEKKLRLFVIDAYALAREVGVGPRINTIMQTAFFILSEILPKEEAIDKITHLNMMREFSYDPFAILGRENCTVGALRAQAAAAGVDTSPSQGMGGAAPKREAGKPVTSGDINTMFKAADAETAL